MEWIHRLELQVDDKAIRRGNGYYRGHLVRLLSGSETHVQAEVQGSRVYSVDVSLTESAIMALCTCPYFDSGNVCKHIWATLLAAHEQGHLGPIATMEIPFINVDWDFTPADRTAKAPVPAPPKIEPWKADLSGLRAQAPKELAQSPRGRRKILYIVDPAECRASGGLLIKAAASRLKRNGEWGKPAFHESWIRDLDELEPEDRRLLALLGGGRESYDFSPGTDRAASRYRLPRESAEVLVPLLCATGRFVLRADVARADSFSPLQWDGAGSWSFDLQVEANAQSDCYEITGYLRQRGANGEADQRVPLAEPLMLVSGLVFFRDRAALFDAKRSDHWIAFLRRNSALRIPRSAGQELLAELAGFPEAPPLEFPAELQLELRTPDRPPSLTVRQGKPVWNTAGKLECDVTFHYGDVAVPESNTAFAVRDSADGRFFRRAREVENATLQTLFALGVLRTPPWEGSRLHIPSAQLPQLVMNLIGAGWRVEAEGKVYRNSSAFNLQVRSGIDWFEMEGSAMFDDQSVPMPEILKAISRGHNSIQLGDGTFGMLPEAWLARFRMVADFGREQDGKLRFERYQAGLLDVLLAGEPNVTFDAAFTRIRAELETFAGIEAAAAPATFRGELRHYQKEGLAWLYFTRKFGFGGCLADDMGLGKTVQVLALLDSDARQGPVLVVVPRSLVFNWKQEAARFAPRLRVLDQTTPERKERWNDYAGSDIILTTYGTMLRDILILKDLTFDTVILDEAQIIKNASTESAKAVRLLKSSHRLVMTGTPIENRLADLWSLFEFLNPGMLGTVATFRSGMADREVLAKALRPFILRRTKEQVATELPAKTEQTIYCELEGGQRKIYDDLRDHYRGSLLAKVDKDGVKKSRMHILEALLRLRQAACHPGLIDRKHADSASAKMDALMPQLAEILEEGHKALVFSQFTSLLSIVKKKLDAEKIVYEYLDGKTRDREAHVRRFQDDPKCPLFLISLKAGGLGLNLTAAEYVFLLDPWWNPAVEAQAVDRSHRIGQTKRVFAYRLIARNTVEEKILDLQKNKRELADAIISEDNSVLSGLTKENLELLLS